jgi:hypothetical protein
MRPLVCGMKIQQLPAESVKVTTWGLAVVLLCYCPFAHAQTSKTSAASADRAALTTYTDRLIRNGDLAALTQESEDDRSGTTGHARSLIIEASVAQILPSSNTSGGLVDANSQAQNEFGVVVMGRYQTDNYGLLGLDASVRFASAQSGLAGKASARDALVTLSTRDFPLGGGLMADGSVGQVIESTIPLARDQSRFFLPISPLLGASLILRKLRPLDQNSSPDDPDVSSTLNLTIGEPGTLSGLHLRNFSQLGGILVTGGGQVTISPGISAGIQAILVNNTASPFAVQPQLGDDATSTNSTLTSQGVMASANFTGDNLRIQGNAIWTNLTEAGQAGIPNTVVGASAANGITGSARGAWIDGFYRSGKQSHAAGIYYFGPNLYWGTSTLVNNAYGAYYRFASSSQRWRWQFSLDGTGSVDGRTPSGGIASANVRRQVNFTTSVGISGTVRVANGTTASQLSVYSDFVSKLGSSRAELGWSQDANTQNYHLSATQAWKLPNWLPTGARLSTQFSYDHIVQTTVSTSSTLSQPAGRSNNFGIAVSAAADIFADVSIDGTIAYNTSASSSASIYGPIDATGVVSGNLVSQHGQAFSANLSVTARLSSRLSLWATLSDTSTSLYARYGLYQAVTSPLGLTAEQIARQQKSTLRLVAGYLTLRYSLSAGRMTGTLGRRAFAGSGSGNLAGTVFLDANSDSRKEPGEPGVAGIIVILDGIQATRTNTSGSYHFQNIAEGTHSVTVISDSLPLPWAIKNPGDPATVDVAREYQVNVEIGVRSDKTLDIAATR